MSDIVKNEKFVEGDVVRLNSYSPKMTIMRIDGDKCYCVFFNNYEYLSEEELNINIIKLEKSSFSNNQKELKIGDVVRLKSGGPKMTISDITDNKFSTVWFFNGKLIYDYRLEKNTLILEK